MYGIAVKYFLLVISLILGLAFSSVGQTSMNTMNTRAKFKATYIVNFAKYTEWPAAYKQGDFIIGVVGDNDLALNLETAAKTKKINSQAMIVKRFKSPDEVTKCHLIYVSGKSVSEVDPYIKKAKEYNCLTVTEGRGLIDRTSAINFIVVGAAMKYEMNKSLFKQQDLIVSSTLENLATKVIN